RRDALHRLSLCEAREYPRAQPRLFVGDAVHLDGGADLGAGVERIGRRTQERTFRVRTACGSLREERTSGRAVRLPVLRFSDSGDTEERGEQQAGYPPSTSDAPCHYEPLADPSGVSEVPEVSEAFEPPDHSAYQLSAVGWSGIGGRPIRLRSICLAMSWTSSSEARSFSMMSSSVSTTSPSSDSIETSQFMTAMVPMVSWSPR